MRDCLGERARGVVVLIDRLAFAAAGGGCQKILVDDLLIQRVPLKQESIHSRFCVVKSGVPRRRRRREHWSVLRATAAVVRVGWPDESLGLAVGGEQRWVHRRASQCLLIAG